MNENTERHINYARSISEIEKALDKVKLLEAELRALKGKIILEPDLKEYLADPSITQSDRIKTALKMLEDGGISPAIKTAMSMIITLDLIEDIEEIYNVFTGLVNDFKKQTSVEVISAIELDGETLKKIKEDVDRAYGLDVRIRNTVEEPIIGGLIIKIGEKVIDLSVRNKMEDIKAKLKSISLGGEGFGTED